MPLAFQSNVSAFARMILGTERTLLFIVLVFGSIVPIFAQKTEPADSVHNRYVRRNIAWFNPSRANEINGLSLSGFISTELFHSDSLKINGINIGIEPAWL